VTLNTAFPWLSTILFLPAGFAVLLQFVGRHKRSALAGITVFATGLTAAFVALVLLGFNNAPASGGVIDFRFQDHLNWIPAIGASYHVGLDGMAAWILGLNAVVFLVGAVVIPWKAQERLKTFCTLLLLSETATAGVILSLDLLLFYVFWEAMLIPLYFLLSRYGSEKRGPATLKFIIYTVAGSLVMLLSIIYLSINASKNGGSATFDFQELVHYPFNGGVPVKLLGISTLTPGQWAFLGFAIAFVIKIPLVPFHTWLPDLYESCPAAALVFFAGIVSKLGVFGFIRYVLPLFPGPVNDFRWILCALAVVSILYGALMALSETDIKRIVAYASISHLGFVALGVFSLTALGLNGAILQMVNHGIIIAALFLVVSYIEERAGTRDRHELAGLERRMPWLYFFFLIITLAGLGMPGMNSFAGEFSIMLGAFQAAWILAVLAGVGVVLAGWYMLRLHQGLMHEPLQKKLANVGDIRPRQAAVLVPLVAVMIVLGVYPRPVGQVSAATSAQYVCAVEQNCGGGS
jgi:NADH-quinone oxidoreductase subunit M